VTVYCKNIFSPCNTNDQIDPVQDKHDQIDPVQDKHDQIDPVQDKHSKNEILNRSIYIYIYI
jgi:hypothetical protein